MVGSSLVNLYNSSLFFSDNTFESAAPMRLTWLGKHTNAAATTGPAMGPRPASSTPMIYLIYFQSFITEHSFAIISSKWQAARREWQALC